MEFKIYVEDIDRENLNLGIYSSSDNFNIVVTSISDIYPKISRKYKRLLQLEQTIYDTYNDDKMNIFQKYNQAMQILEDRIRNGNCELIINSNSSNCLKKINEVFHNGCIIDITQIKDNKIKKLLNNNEFNNKIKFRDKYNTYSLLNCEEVLNSYKLIEQIKQDIIKYNLTPLEQVIFLYDKVRKKIYRNYEDGESVSRDINEVLNNNYIVCEGYANIIAAVCSSLNIDCEKILWYPRSGNRGHASNLIYINDNYYNVHQFFEVDAVVATKKDENDHDYNNNYKLFLNSLNKAIRIKDIFQNLFIAQKLKVESVNDRYETINKLEDLDAPKILKMNSVNLFLKNVLDLAIKIGNKEMIEMCDNLKKQLENEIIDLNIIKQLKDEYKKLFDRRLEKNIMIAALYKTRRIEHLIEPDEYELSIDTFKKMINYNFPKSKEERLLEFIFEEQANYFDNIKFLEKIEGKDINEKVVKDIKRIELLTLLQKELESKKSKVNVKK